MDASFIPARLFLGQAYVQIGNYDEAIEEFQKALELSDRATEILAELGHALARAGRTGDAQQVLAELMQLLQSKHVSSYGIAIVHIGLDDTEQAFAWFENAMAEQSHFLPLVTVDPRLDGLRSDQRYEKLVEHIGLARLNTTLSFDSLNQ